VQNAINHAFEGRSSVTIRLSARLHGDHVEIICADDGVGMAADILPRIFEPFFTTKEVNKGTGMGLATVYGIVRQHQGWIEVVTAPSQGSTFYIFLPVTEGKPDEITPEAGESESDDGTHTIFVVEDDAQNGPDHIDAHRTIAYVISPYVRKHTVDSTLYSTCSMLRTMELILGMKPMSQFDAAAMPMFASFGPKPDLSPYVAVLPQADLNARNLATAWGHEKSEKMDLTREDAADDLELNEVIWRSVRGADSVMPAPVRAGFVLSAETEEEEEEEERERKRR
jgi:hypothetical protein